jgi:hypothetical protein
MVGETRNGEKRLDRRLKKIDNVQTNVGAKIKDVQVEQIEKMESKSDEQLKLKRKSIFQTIFEKIGNAQTKMGAKIKEAQVGQMEKLMFKRLDGTNVFRYFFDLHMDGMFSSATTNDYLPIEVAEIVPHELMSQLIGLSTACQKVKIPHKWIGSWIAVAYDAGFFPDRSLEDDHNQEADIRSKVICNFFDWGRSELLTADTYQSLSPEDKADRDRFWDLYKEGVDRLSYNATRFYYHQFTASTKWSDVTNTFIGKDMSNLLLNRDKNHGSQENSKWATMLKRKGKGKVSKRNRTGSKNASKGVTW